MVVPKSLRQYKTMAIPAAIAIVFVAVTAYAFVTMDNGADVALVATPYGQTANGVIGQMDAAVPLQTQQTQLSGATEAQLLYLIEEEKLAHDVYLTMYEMYGARIFSNISKSETNHQDRVLALLTSRGIQDPRTHTVGVFQDRVLQALYDDLIDKGSQSLSEAYKVGVAIEERDISDIRDSLQVLDAAQADIQTTLEALLRGSENHLRAFNRQVR